MAILIVPVNLNHPIFGNVYVTNAHRRQKAPGEKEEPAQASPVHDWICEETGTSTEPRREEQKGSTKPEQECERGCL